MRIKSFLIGTIAGGLAIRYLFNTAQAQQSEVNRSQVNTSSPPSKEAALIRLTQPMLPTLTAAKNADHTNDPLKNSHLKRILASVSRAWSSSKFFLLSKSHPAPLSSRWFTIAFCSLLIVGHLLSQTGLPVDHPIPRFGAGLFLTVYSLGAWVLVKILLRSIVTRTWPDIIDRQSKFDMIFTILGFVIVLCAGFLAWYVGWTGSNVGWPFGCGAFVCGIIFETGPSRLAEYYSPSLPRESQMELKELLNLVQTTETYSATLRISQQTGTAFRPSQNEVAEHERKVERLDQLRKKWNL
jgi:hypothetical protein